MKRHNATITLFINSSGKQRAALVHCSCGWDAGGCSFGEGRIAHGEWLRHIPDDDKKGSVKYKTFNPK